MSAVDATETMMEIATTEALAAGIPLPPILMVALEFQMSTGLAADLEKGGEEWRAAADLVQQTADELRQSVAAISARDWTAQDRRGYETKIEEFCSQLEVLHVFCMAVGIALTVLAWALFVYSIFAVAMGTFVAALGVAAVAALASVVGSPAYPEILAVAGTCLVITSVATGVLAIAGQLAGVTMAGGSLVSAIVETNLGNDAAFDDFVQAQTTGAAGALANLAQNAANTGLDFLNNKPGKDFPLSSVDLDADRDYDQTWNVGAGAEFTTPGGGQGSVSAHAQYGDEGWQGAQVEGGYEGAGGWSVEGNAGWEQDADGNNTYTAGVSGTTAGGANAGVSGEYNDGDGSWTAEATAGYEGPGGSGVSGTAGVGQDGDGNTTYSGGVEGTAGGYSGGAEGSYNSGDGSWEGSAHGEYEDQYGNTYGGSTGASGDGSGNTQWTTEGTTPAGTYTSETPPWDL